MENKSRNGLISHKKLCGVAIDKEKNRSIEGKIFVGWKNKQTEEAFVGGVWNTTKDIELVAVWGNTANGSGWSPFA